MSSAIDFVSANEMFDITATTIPRSGNVMRYVDVSPAFHRAGPLSRRIRMRYGSHLLRVRVQDRRSDALVCPEPRQRRERQTDRPGDQHKPDWDSILSHVCSFQATKPRATAA
jgi:hypothetical protein